MRGLVVGIPELHAIGAAILLAARSTGSAAGRAVEVVEQVGLVFWQAHGAGGLGGSCVANLLLGPGREHVPGKA